MPLHLLTASTCIFKFSGKADIGAGVHVFLIFEMQRFTQIHMWQLLKSFIWLNKPAWSIEKMSTVKTEAVSPVSR